MPQLRTTLYLEHPADHYQHADGLHAATAQHNALEVSIFFLYSCKMSNEYVAQPLCVASFATR